MHWRKNLILFLVLGICTSLRAQTGKISGIVYDSLSGEPMIGAAVFIEGTTTGCISDLDGVFAIGNLKPGYYTVMAKLVSYQTAQIKKVLVSATENTTLRILLKPSVNQLKEYVIERSTDRSSSGVLLMEQKEAAVMRDGISADMIKKTPDNAASDVLKRVSGTSIQEGKFAIIRGLNDRYNFTLINGSPLPSTEADRKAFSFDLIPSLALDNMIIAKTASPDLPAEFAGGVIHLNTKEIADEPTLVFSASSGFHSATTGNVFHSDAIQTKPFAPLNKGGRGIPEGIPDGSGFKALSPGEPEKLRYSKLFPNTWKLNRRKALPDSRVQLSAGSPFRFLGKPGGVMMAVSHSASSRFSKVERNAFDVNEGNQLTSALQDSLNKEEINSSAILNLSLNPVKNGYIRFRNLLSIQSEDQTTIRSGTANLSDPATAQSIRGTAFMHTASMLYSGQLGADYHISRLNLKIQGVLGYHHLGKEMPDFRKSTYSRMLTESDAPFRAQLGANVQPDQAGRFYSSLNEDMQSAAWDVQFPLEFFKSDIAETKVKAGFTWYKRMRTFDARQFGYIFRSGPETPAGLRELSQENLFDPENFRYSKGRFFLIDEATNPNDRYGASSSLHAAYLLFDQKFYKKLRLVWGFRNEVFEQNLDALSANAEPVMVRNKHRDWLPSLNASYSLNPKTLIRFAASRTLSRSEFREIAPFAFYDFNIDYVVSGRPDLRQTSIANFDLRFEWFPALGELVSFSIFSKTFTNAIEFINDPDVGVGSRRFGYANVAGARNLGVEAEFRKNLALLDTLWGTSFFSTLSLVGNFAWIHSETEVSSLGWAADGNRPLQGQSPYLINGGIQYIHPEKNYSFSLMLNKMGRRIAYVGNALIPDIYEAPRTVLDMQFRAKISKRVEARLNLSDALAQDQVFYMDMDKNGRFQEIKDNTIFKYSQGMAVSAGLNFSLN